MSRITGEELRRRRAAFVDKAGQAFDQMLGDDGQNGLVTFEEREDRACDLGDGLTRRLLADHLAADESANPGVAGGGPGRDAKACGANPAGHGGTGPRRPPLQSLPADFFPCRMSA
jgi:hypothetical protein